MMFFTRGSFLRRFIMTRWIVAGLVVLNMLLGAGVYLRLGGERTAVAQGIGGGGGEYAVVAGFNNAQTILYILEVNTGRMIAIRTDPVNHKAELVTRGSVTPDLARQ
jgi:hypothetical protein